MTIEAAQERAATLVELAHEMNFPFSTFITTLMKHGGLPSLTDPDLMTARLQPYLASEAGTAMFQMDRGPEFSAFISSFSGRVSAALDNVFTKLVPNRPYDLSPDLIYHIADHNKGRVSSPPGTPDQSSPDFPAAFTFVGQFIDHDLTLNSVNLILRQDDQVLNVATPLIDLDSVYGLRSELTNRPKEIFAGDKFRLDASTGVIDLPRSYSADQESNVPAIFDARNDENQLILQVHILLERLHNKFIDLGYDFDTARKYTIINWQSFIIHQYLPHLIRADVLAELMGYVDGGDFSKLKAARQHESGEWYLLMPHEFSIGFRMGHSQLRSQYRLQSAGGPVTLFDPALDPVKGSFPPLFDDLRGGQKLVQAHEIEWPTFISSERANALDAKVTRAVFDLPKSAIPDDIKYVHNLPVRNLVRSSMIGVCAGEDLADFYDPQGNKFPHLQPEQIEADEGKQRLFARDGKFRTPLWYYLLKEAEVSVPSGGTSPQNPLGPLGSYLVGEVLLCAMRFNDVNWWDEKGESSSWSVNQTPEVSLLDIASFV